MTTKQKVGEPLRWQGQNYTIVAVVPKLDAEGATKGVAIRAKRNQGYEREERELRDGGTDMKGAIKRDGEGKPIRIPGVEFLPDICVSDYSGVRTEGGRLKLCENAKQYKGLLAVSLGRVMTQIPQKLDDEVKDLARGLAVAIRDRLGATYPPGPGPFWFHPNMHFPKFQYPAPHGSSPLSEDEWKATAKAFLEGDDTDG